MSSDQVIQMRDFIAAAEDLVRAQFEQQPDTVLVESAQEMAQPGTSLVLEDLQEVVFRLRAFTESADSSQALGIELGMQRAAEMIENLIRRHSEGV